MIEHLYVAYVAVCVCVCSITHFKLKFTVYIEHHRINKLELFLSKYFRYRPTESNGYEIYNINARTHIFDH